MDEETRNKLELFGLGMAVGAVLAHKLVIKHRIKKFNKWHKQLATEVELHLELMKWFENEGRHMDEDRFEEEWAWRTQFIDITTQ